MSSSPAFDIDVTRRVGEQTITLTLRAEAGLTALLGRSGAGKTSILHMVAGLARPDRGHVRVAGETLFGDGIDLPPQRRRVGYVFQEPRLFPHLRVRGNLLYGAPKDAALDASIEMLGIGHLLDRWPASLSGGEAKRVAIGRALLASPRFLLMDEPLASLDRARGEEIMQAIERIRDQVGLPILYVTHDPAEAERLATHRVTLN